MKNYEGNASLGQMRNVIASDARGGEADTKNFEDNASLGQFKGDQELDFRAKRAYRK